MDMDTVQVDKDVVDSITWGKAWRRNGILKPN